MVRNGYRQKWDHGFKKGEEKGDKGIMLNACEYNGVLHDFLLETKQMLSWIVESFAFIWFREWINKYHSLGINF